MQPTDVFNLIIKITRETFLIMLFFATVQLTLGDIDTFVIGFIFRGIWSSIIKRVHHKEV